jgi:hypothetical protein
MMTATFVPEGNVTEHPASEPLLPAANGKTTLASRSLVSFFPLGFEESIANN